MNKSFYDFGFQEPVIASGEINDERYLERLSNKQLHEVGEHSFG